MSRAMEFEQVVRSRRMVRSFAPDPLDFTVIQEICDLARRAPSAGNTAAVEFLVLEGSAVADYWDTTLPVERRVGFAWPGLLRAPTLVVVWTDPDAYVRRYRQSDKAVAGRILGSVRDEWPVPYWYVDSGAVVMTMLLAAVDRGLGACLFGLFRHEEAVRRRFSVPLGKRAVGTVAFGLPDSCDRLSSSAQRPRAPLSAAVHRSRWGRR